MSQHDKKLLKNWKDAEDKRRELGASTVEMGFVVVSEYRNLTDLRIAIAKFGDLKFSHAAAPGHRLRLAEV